MRTVMVSLLRSGLETGLTRSATAAEHDAGGECRCNLALLADLEPLGVTDVMSSEGPLPLLRFRPVAAAVAVSLCTTERVSTSHEPLILNCECNKR